LGRLAKSRILLTCPHDRFRRGMGAGNNPLFVPVLRGNMTKTDSNEFDSFVPHLRKHCGRTIGRFLVIANCIHVIGETVGQIVDESGSPTDIRAFYRNCLSALHGEVKNWLACMLHSSKAMKRVFTNSTVAIMESLKGKKSIGKDSSKAVSRDAAALIFSLYTNLSAWLMPNPCQHF
jgi:hypothetical protein